MAKNFGSKNNLFDNRLLVVDSLNLSFRYKHSGSVDFAEDYLKTVKSFANSYGCKHVVIVADKGASSYRKKILPSYKANRAEKRLEQTPEERFEFEQFLEDFEKTLLVCAAHFPVLRYKGVEADDIAAYINKNARQYGFDKIWNISSDRDWDLLVSETSSRFSYVTRKEVTLENWRNHYDCEPEEYISMKCLSGDLGDGIPGVEAIGPKRSSQLIKAYGSAMDIAMELPIESKYKYMQNLNKCKDLILNNYLLMDLLSYCEDAIGEENVKDVHAKMLSIREYST